MICNTCGEKHCRAREEINFKKSFPIPDHITQNEKYIQLLQKKAEETGKCSQYV